MHRFLKLTGAAVLALGLAACSSEEPTTPTGSATLTLNPSPRSIVDDGTLTSVRINTLTAEGTPGTGEVELTAQAGSFDNDAKTVMLTLVDGKATVGFRCLKASDAACSGAVRLEGTWNGTTGGTSVTVTAKTTPTTPTDGGTDPGTDGGTDPNAPVVGEPANIVYQANLSKPALGIRSSNLDISTPIVFLVTDLNGNPVPKVTLNFDVRGVGGVALSAYSAETNGTGLATTTLLSGDEVGIATVRATLPNTSLAASTLGTPIIGARPSDEGLTVSCDQINLAANATETPPRQDIGTICRAQLVDRFKNPVSLLTSVNWYSEAGSIQSPIVSKDTGTVESTFRTAGKWPPANVPPLDNVVNSNGSLGNEWRAGSRNPRDMLVTVIAVTAGEEEFHDGSGVSNGVKDGQWNPGEWFVDVTEPYVDENDNQQYDLGEPFIDTQRLNCATGTREPKNGKWDGPNGCWDGDILIWRPTHVLYSGFATGLGGPGSTFEYNPSNVVSVPKGGQRGVTVTVFDDYINPISPDGADMKAEGTFTKGRVEFLPDARLDSRYYGFSIFQERLVATEAANTKGYTTDGTVCDPATTAPSGAATNPKLARCVRQYRINNFIRGNIGVIKLSSTSESTDPAESNTVTISIGNEYSAVLDTISVTMQ